MYAENGRKTGLICAVLSAYPVVLVAALFLVRFLEPSRPVLAAIYFLPFQLWLLPLLAVVPAAVLFSRWALLPCAFCLWFVLFPYAGLRVGISKKPDSAGGQVITCMTNNIGQNNRQSFAGFMQLENPDIVLLQDSRFGAFTAAYRDRHVGGVGEFSILSKYPIKSARLLPELRPGHSPAAARFELDVNGRLLVVYNVHLPTPRSQLLSLGFRGIFLAIADPSAIQGGRKKYDFSGSMQERSEMIERLKKTIASEPSPVLVGGDFNAPPQAALHRALREMLQDAFMEKGSGFGFTFPGFTRNPLTLFGPWLRLDFLYGRGLQPVYCHTEPDRRSQHRAVAAGFLWEENPKPASLPVSKEPS